MIQRDAWAFTDEDQARLQPLVEDMGRRLDTGIEQICRVTENIEERIRILQGFCEALGERLRELVLEQVDRGEWAGRGIKQRADVDVIITVDAAQGVLDGNNLINFRMMPTEHLS